MTYGLQKKSSNRPASPRWRPVYILKQLGLSSKATWAQAHRRLRLRLIAAHKSNDKSEQILWSDAKNRVKKYCLKEYNTRRCAECNALISHTSERCMTCFRRRVVEQNKGRKKPYVFRGELSNVIATIVDGIDSPFWLPQVCFNVHQQKLALSRSHVRSVVYYWLKNMIKRGEIHGGGLKNWTRYEKTEKYETKTKPVNV